MAGPFRCSLHAPTSWLTRYLPGKVSRRTMMYSKGRALTRNFWNIRYYRTESVHPILVLELLHLAYWPILMGVVSTSLVT